MGAFKGLRSLGVMLAISATLAGCMQPDGYEVASTAGDQAFKDKQYDSAERGYLRAVDFAEQEYHKGQGESNLIEGLKSLGKCYSAQNKYAEAEPHYLRAAQLLESKVGTDMVKSGKLSPDFENWVSVLLSVADNYRAEGKFADAEKTYKRVLDLESKLTNPDKVIKAEAQSELAECYAKQGKQKDAVTLFKTALADVEKAEGPRKQEVLIDTLEDYAQTLMDLKQTSEAEKLHERAKELRAKLNVENN
ncbi:MAG: tetratricopeptide repeat protein [Candidatus Obscuribacterales bacterium]|nr:tetratricopeptide repeat protein [Candidatus Obscuribacterales bacterium]